MADEARAGLKTVKGKKLCAKGKPCVGLSQHRFQNIHVFGAVRALGGDALFCWSKKVNKESFGEFLARLSARRPDRLLVVQVDNAGWHVSKKLVIPNNIRLLLQPPYSPETNLVENVWKEMKRPAVNRNYATLQQLVNVVDDSLHALRTGGGLRRLASPPYMIAAIKENPLSLN